SSKGPSRDWLKIVKTSEARSKIRQWFKKEKRADNIQLGRTMVENELKRIGRQSTEAQRLEIAANVAARIGIQSADDLYNTIGYGGLSVSKLVTKLHDEFDRVVGVPEAAPAPTHTERVQEAAKKQAAKNIKSNSGIIVDGERGCSVKFAKCCNPLPGDPVIGFITKGFGISIHKQDCPNVRDSITKDPANAARWVEARWDDGFDHRNDSVFEALLQIHALDRAKLLADVSLALADMKVAILNIYTQRGSGQKVILNLTVSCKNREHYDAIVSRLKQIPDVVDVVRGFS
ncbi:MAG: bifunctional (p)ppGpp synthetase/guanosine-3',5'-bis(diphosphate) 3'-pyrophosphohydrolase, partial [Clostridia bacterium]|nr:bifunctional (p)ppGpp synthetase/guanosine-3',5'-bis(diphosphate) 3'-pyrophosphohydrolase [Clostridia bacterium]